jgi:hypothetical protein
LFSQDASLKVFNKETKQPIPYANVSFEGITTNARTVRSLEGKQRFFDWE